MRNYERLLPSREQQIAVVRVDPAFNCAAKPWRSALLVPATTAALICPGTGSRTSGQAVWLSDVSVLSDKELQAPRVALMGCHRYA